MGWRVGHVPWFILLARASFSPEESDKFENGGILYMKIKYTTKYLSPFRRRGERDGQRGANGIRREKSLRGRDSGNLEGKHCNS